MGFDLLTRGIGIVGRLALNGGAQISSGSSAPLSGTLGNPRFAPAGSLYLHSTSGVLYYNEGTKLSPYWTPTSYDQPGLRAWHTDFRDGVGKLEADVVATVILPSGVRVHGQGIEVNGDSGLVVTYTENLGAIAALTVTNESSHTAALGVGTTALVYQPDTHGPMVIDVEFTNNTAITLRALFCGFIGASANALDPVVTGATVTMTLVANDLQGMFMDVGLTDGDGIFAPHNKANAAANILTSATGVDLGSTIPAAGTYTRWRVEISAAGVFTCFIDKAQVTRITDAALITEQMAPSFYIETTSDVTKRVDIKRFATWGLRA